MSYLGLIVIARAEKLLQQQKIPKKINKQNFTKNFQQTKNLSKKDYQKICYFYTIAFQAQIEKFSHTF